MTRHAELRARIEASTDPERAAHSARFFKTGPGQYGCGDRFRGIRVPLLRRLAREFSALDLADCTTLLHSAWHEDRLLALLILVEHYRRGSPEKREVIHRLYLDNIGQINNWDLVDTSAEHIVGAHIDGNNLGLLDELAESANLWKRRIAVIATFHFIKRGEFGPTLRLAEHLLLDREDLIHKAVGWMLREVGKRAPESAHDFLKRHYLVMPRTMLRYAIERFPEPQRRAYLAKRT